MRNAKWYDSKNISLFKIINQILFNVQVAISKKKHQDINQESQDHGLFNKDGSIIPG